MSRTSSHAAYAMFLSLAGYNPEEAVRRLNVPLRVINGDLFPTDVAGGRLIKADFAVKLLEHTGHYPMLERPVAFDRMIGEVVEELCHHGVIAQG